MNEKQRMVATSIKTELEMIEAFNQHIQNGIKEYGIYILVFKEQEFHINQDQNGMFRCWDVNHDDTVSVGETPWHALDNLEE